ncbi:hypothetical protein PNEG_00475 [Pneumocystis murina B123]|uniref:Cenp-O kinetochore centromere component n=1 Tax=Pneumocystis murina (strain B123) TaxID=1069680 RepID=M7NRT1_PNEMU|nr:hypothetical protein PNEG_00475 [Pneumocystis murina B123]EMR11458.1 hypothetical protein PNEG_00475 [Pneumocystis murina B123]
MTSILAQYQTDISSLHEELKKLKSKRNDLLLKMLEERPVHEYTSAKAPQDLKPIESQWNIEKIYRLSGITFFIPSNPEKYFHLKKKLLYKLIGARIDIFHKGVFLEPHYLIFRVNTILSLYKHTIPNFINIDLLVKKWLNKDINIFLALIRKQLLYHTIRSSHIRELETIFSDFTILCDPSATLVQIKNQKYTINIKYGDTNIEKTIIINSKGDREIELEKKIFDNNLITIHHFLK